MSTNNSVNVADKDYTTEIKTYIDYYNRGAFGTKTSIREHMWILFCTMVGTHIREYTVPQYGDYPNDNLASFTADDCKREIKKYVARFDSNSRGEKEALLDLVKIAHYAASAFLKATGYEEMFKEAHLEMPEATKIDEGVTPPAAGDEEVMTTDENNTSETDTPTNEVNE